MRIDPTPSRVAEILGQIVRIVSLPEYPMHRRSPLQSSPPDLIPLLTWNAEGNSDPTSPFYSRLPHHPSLTSGVTIGRGYDMLHRSRDTVLSDLILSGAPYALAYRLSDGAGRSGMRAAEFVQATRTAPRAWELSVTTEQRLFMKEWRRMHDDVKRISERVDVQRTYGTVDWDALDPRILELVVDLRFRGDYTPRTRLYIQPVLVQNDWGALRAIMSSRALWPNVPEQRFNARLKFVSGF